MKSTFPILFAVFALFSSRSSAQQANDIQIAGVVRHAVQLADSTLLHSSLNEGWRDYLKLMSLELKAELQPLLLIKFDEDVAFRTKLKAIIRREARFDRLETEHFIYYYEPGMKPSETTLELLEAHCNSFLAESGIRIAEKIPYVYSQGEGVVVPFDELDAGIVSPEPLDFARSIEAILNFVNEGSCFLHGPLAIIYGDCFRNPALIERHLSLCEAETKQMATLSVFDIWAAFRTGEVSPEQKAFAFVFAHSLLREFDLPAVVSFSRELRSVETLTDFDEACRIVFGRTLADLEMQAFPPDSSSVK